MATRLGITNSGMGHPRTEKILKVDLTRIFDKLSKNKRKYNLMPNQEKEGHFLHSFRKIVCNHLVKGFY